MKVAVFSDVHGNLEAYGAVLTDVAAQAGIAALWCLGDVVGYGADPERCAAITMALSDAAPPGYEPEPELRDVITALQGKLNYVMKGNHDAAAAGDPIISSFNPAARAAARWTANVVSEPVRKYLDGLPLTVRAGVSCLVHASPADPATYPYVLSEEDAAAAFAATAATVTFYGHTHVPLSLRDEEGGVAQVPLGELSPGKRFLINVGSVGQPRDGDPRAAYLIYDGEKRTASLVRLPYDVDAAADKIRRAGLPRELASRLYAGW